MCISFNGYFTFGPTLFRWCPSFGAFIPFFPLGAQSFLLKSSPREYVRAVKALAPLGVMLVSSKTITTLQAFHPSNLSMPCLDSLMDFKPKIELDFLKIMFRSTFIHSTHLLARMFSCMVFEHLRHLFDLEDSVNKFS